MTADDTHGNDRNPVHSDGGSDGGTAGTTWFLFRGNDILLCSGATPALPFGEEPPLARELLRSGHFGPPDGKRLAWGELPPNCPIPGDLFQKDLRSLWALLGERAFSLAGTAFQLMNWTRNTLYCGRCGSPMQNSAKERARECPVCSFVTYPPVSPAIIVAVRRGNRLLLGRSPHFPKGRYSVLAGFVEPGESLEEAVAREVFEEVHVAVKDVRYVASQPWPFPHSLMVGFTALWGSGEIRIDEKEIEDARWFSPEDLPDLPPPSSISRRLIDAFLLEMGEDPKKRAGVPWT